MMTWVKRGVTAAGLIIVLGAVLTVVWLRSSLPQTSGSIDLAGLSAPVVITRDNHGIPHIEADTEADLYFALGFVHGQDRLWQMEMNRRIAQGRLAELVGEPAVGLDKYMRTLSVSDRAEKIWDTLDSDTQKRLQSYADGINAFLENHPGALPPEFTIIGVEPEPFTPVDSLRWMKMMALNLSGNMYSELQRLSLAAVLEPERVSEFLAPYPGEAPFVVPDLKELYGDIDLSRLAPDGPMAEEPEPSRGSNNWVISGEHTATGKPFLANDPHLGLATPSLWYLVHLKVQNRDIVGVSLPSLPGVVLGRNSHMAWGFTNTGPDTQDLYLERLSPDGAQVVTASGLKPVTVRQEEIKVKGGDSILHQVRETPHGPVMSDVISEAREKLPEGYVLALRWTALEPGDTTIAATNAVNNTRTFQELVQSLRIYISPQQNIVFADTDGNIGYYAPGRVPVRAADNDINGHLPSPGWDARYDWLGYVPYDELPLRFNPESGIIATANEKIVEDSYPHYLTSDWAPPFRGGRIRTLLRATDKHDLESMKAIQTDEYSSIADDLLPPMLAAMAESEDPMLTALRGWDRVMDAEDPEPLIFAAWHRELARLIYADELGEEFERSWRHRVIFLTNVLNDVGGQSRWCDDITTEAKESCAMQIAGAFEAAKSTLMHRLGSGWQDWRWGDVHVAVQEHRPLSQVPVLGELFETRIAIGGGSDTVNVARGTFTGPEPHSVSHGPSYRAIYDLSDLGNSLYMIPTGQSGNPLSSHYDDFLEPWAKGEYIRIPTDIEALKSPDQLTLNPVR